MYEDKDRIMASLYITDMTAAGQLCRYNKYLIICPKHVGHYVSVAFVDNSKM